MRASRRCEACTRRHVKCVADGSTCQQCSTAGIECIWPPPRTHAKFVFRCENAFADGSMPRTRGLPSAAHEILDVSQPASKCLPQQPSIPPTTLKLLANNKYVHYFLRQALILDSNLEGYIVRYGLPNQDTPTSHLIQDAMTANMLVYFGLTERSHEAMNMSRSYYDRALCMTNMAIQDAVCAQSDEMLLAIMLLGAYEGHTGGYIGSDQFPSSFRHVRGAVSLLPYREPHTSQSRFLCNIIWRRAVRMTLQTGTKLEPVVRLYIENQYLGKEEAEEGDERDLVMKLLYTYMGQLADTSAELHNTLRLEPGQAREMALKLSMNSAARLDTALEELQLTMACMAEYHACAVSEPTPKSALASIMDQYHSRTSFTSVRAAHELSLLYASQLRIKDMFCRVQSSYSPTMDISSAEHAIEELAIKIFAVVPYLLDDGRKPGRTLDEICRHADAVYCGLPVYALHSICSAYHTTAKQRTVAKDVLLCLGQASANGTFSVLFSEHGRLGRKAVTSRLGGRQAYV